MLITDSQVHVWQAHSPERPWPEENRAMKAFVAVPGARAHRAEPISAQEMVGMMTAAGVDRAVIVPPSPVGDSNEYALETAAMFPGRFVVMGRFNPKAPGAREALPGWLRQPYMAGIRMTFHQPRWSAWLDDGSIDWFWADCERHDIALMLLMPGRLQDLARIAKRHPGLRLIVDHMGIHSHHRDAQCLSDLEQLLPLAQCPNVSVKTSAAPCYTDDAYPFRAFEPILARIYDAFGPARMFWGSDVSRLPCTYREAVEHFTRALDCIPASDLPAVMGESLSRCLKWPAPDAHQRSP